MEGRGTAFRGAGLIGDGGGPHGLRGGGYVGFSLSGVHTEPDPSAALVEGPGKDPRSQFDFPLELSLQAAKAEPVPLADGFQSPGEVGEVIHMPVGIDFHRPDVEFGSVHESRAFDLVEGKLYRLGPARIPGGEDFRDDRKRTPPFQVEEEPHRPGIGQYLSSVSEKSVFSFGGDSPGGTDPGFRPDVLAIARIATHVEGSPEQYPADAFVHQTENTPARFLAVTRAGLFKETEEGEGARDLPPPDFRITDGEFSVMNDRSVHINKDPVGGGELREVLAEFAGAMSQRFY